MAPTRSSCPRLRSCIGCLCYAVALGSLIASIPIFYDAMPAFELATVLRLYKDEFVQFDGQCEVVNVTECFHTTTDAQDPYTLNSERDPEGTPHCWRSYMAVFSVPESRLTYPHYPEFVLESSREGCPKDKCAWGDKIKATPAGLTKGKKHPCWHPAGSQRIDVRYQCGNGPCYKLTDPASIAEPAIAKAERVVYLGGALAGAGLLIGFVSFFVWPPSGFARRPSTEPTVERHVEAVSTKRRPWHEETRKENDMKVPLSPKKKSEGGRKEVASSSSDAEVDDPNQRV